jgi:hypothetical protein
LPRDCRGLGEVTALDRRSIERLEQRVNRGSDLGGTLAAHCFHLVAGNLANGILGIDAEWRIRQPTMRGRPSRRARQRNNRGEKE